MLRRETQGPAHELEAWRRVFLATGTVVSAERSPATGRRSPLTQVCRVYRVPRSTVYDTAARTASPQGPPSAKRGPKTPASDETLVAAIRAVLAATSFHGEGHRKVRVRLRQHGHRVSRTRVLRLMRLHGLLAPQRAGHRHGDPAHAGTITTAAPNVLWGTDATRFYTAKFPRHRGLPCT